jgi:hypothetical protein
MDYSGLTLVLREAEMSESLLPGLEPPVQRPSGDSSIQVPDQFQAEDLPAAAHFPIGAISEAAAPKAPDNDNRAAGGVVAGGLMLA